MGLPYGFEAMRRVYGAAVLPHQRAIQEAAVGICPSEQCCGFPQPLSLNLLVKKRGKCRLVVSGFVFGCRIVISGLSSLPYRCDSVNIRFIPD